MTMNEQSINMKIQTNFKRTSAINNNNSIITLSRRSIGLCIVISLLLIVIGYLRFIYYIAFNGSSIYGMHLRSADGLSSNIPTDSAVSDTNAESENASGEDKDKSSFNVEKDINMLNEEMKLKNKRFIHYGQSDRKFPDYSVDDDDVHVVFSTGCNLFQHWQAEVLLHSHLLVGQRGKITRIVSGCETEHLKREHSRFLVRSYDLF